MLVDSKILAFIGDGEGKTSAAIGHAIRAAGHGKKVAIVQFLKGRENSGEYKYFSKTSGSGDGIEIYLAGSPEFILQTPPKQTQIDKAKEGLALVNKLLNDGNHFVLILDELLDAQAAGVISIKDIEDIMENIRTSCKEPKHIILTGRILPPELSSKVDLITQMKKIKHYYDRGEKGIEGLDW